MIQGMLFFSGKGVEPPALPNCFSPSQFLKDLRNNDLFVFGCTVFYFCKSGKVYAKYVHIEKVTRAFNDEIKIFGGPQENYIVSPLPNRDRVKSKDPKTELVTLVQRSKYW